MEGTERYITYAVDPSDIEEVRVIPYADFGVDGMNETREGRSDGDDHCKDSTPVLQGQSSGSSVVSFTSHVMQKGHTNPAVYLYRPRGLYIAGTSTAQLCTNQY